MILYLKDGYVFEQNIAEEIHVSGNPSRLMRAVYNLIDNAVRHAGGDKWIGITLKSENSKAVIEISDHGTGIPSEMLTHIWERYYTSHQRGNKGISGLGLAIVKQIVIQHKGICFAESEAGKGSTFHIVLDKINLYK